MSTFKIESLVGDIQKVVPKKEEKIYVVQQRSDEGDLIQKDFVIREGKIYFVAKVTMMSTFPTQIIQDEVKVKSLLEITKEEVERIAFLCDVKAISYQTNALPNAPIITIVTRKIENGDHISEKILIFKTGKILIHYHTGNWGGSGYEAINTLPIIDYLREQGYQFNY